MKPRSLVPRLLATIVALSMMILPAPLTAQEEAARALDADQLKALPLRNIGPAISSGRVVDLAVPRQDKDTVYVATASGGLWKSANHGTTWTPVFEREGTISIGAIAVADSNPNVVWVGTGEANNQRSSSWGDGVYKSEDGGKTWHHMGLRESQHVGGIAIHPEDPDVVYVAAVGALWGPNEERGIFRTTDGGDTWEKVLFVSEHTGAVDVLMDPRDPDRIYAAAYQRERRNWSFIGGGPEGGIYRTEDGGDTWEKLTNGLPDPDIGKIGLSIHAANPDIVYAIVEAQDRNQTGVYRSMDRGASWEHRSTNNPTPWYYSQIRVAPDDPDHVWVMGTRASVSEDGGRTWRNDGAPDIHVDHHALWIDPDDSDRMIIGNDGGVAFTYDGGATWDFAPNLPVTQYYHIAVDMREPFYWVYGGTQDNNTWGGPSGTRNEDGIVNDDWFVTVGGDGFYAQIDPTDPTIVYSESQYGNLVRFNTRTGERKRIQPLPPEGEAYRWNWSSPLLISPHDNSVIFFAANRVFRSSNQGDDWTVISPDVTRQLDREEMEMMGRNWGRDAVAYNEGISEYGNVTTLDESPLRQHLLAIGTDDGLVQISDDGGESWTRYDTFPGIPELTRVSRLTWSRHAEGRLYVAFDGHKDNDFRPFLLVSEDYGATWSPLHAGLPEFGSTRVIREHPRNPDFLAAGTEFGLFLSIDRGATWTEVENLPTVAVHDIVFHPRDNDIVIGTHGRGIWILDDTSVIEQMGSAENGALLATVRPAVQLREFDRGRDSQGARYFRAPNPPRGAILTMYLADEALQPADAGEDPEAESAGGRDGADRLTTKLELLDADGSIVRQLDAPSRAGIHRVVWDLRTAPPYEPPRNQGGGFGFFRPRGAQVLPGTYTARLTIGDRQITQPVEVHLDPEVETDTASLRARYEMSLELNAMQATLHAASQTVNSMTEDLGAVTAALEGMVNAPQELADEARRLTRELRSVNTDLEGQRGFPRDPEAPRGISQIVGQLFFQVDGYSGAPSDTQRTEAAGARERLEAAVAKVNELREQFDTLNGQLDEAGVPWTPGRPVGGDD
jgi:photosystem II stability/assembly factor-like uncharacterized protein